MAMKEIASTDANETSEPVDINDTIQLGFMPLQVAFASGVTGTVTVQGRLDNTMPWEPIGEVFTTSALAEITVLGQLRVVTANLAGGSSPKIRVGILERFYNK